MDTKSELPAITPLPPIQCDRRYPLDLGFAYLGVCRATGYKLINSGELKTITVGGNGGRAGRRFIGGDELLRHMRAPSEASAA